VEKLYLASTYYHKVSDWITKIYFVIALDHPTYHRVIN